MFQKDFSAPGFFGRLQDFVTGWHDDKLADVIWELGKGL